VLPFQKANKVVCNGRTDRRTEYRQTYSRQTDRFAIAIWRVSVLTRDTNHILCLTWYNQRSNCIIITSFTLHRVKSQCQCNIYFR